MRFGVLWTRKDQVAMPDIYRKAHGEFCLPEQGLMMEGAVGDESERRGSGKGMDACPYLGEDKSHVCVRS